jgi:hypothetical protein
MTESIPWRIWCISGWYVNDSKDRICVTI